jgi:hypothetical protein
LGKKFYNSLKIGLTHFL